MGCGRKSSRLRAGGSSSTVLYDYHHSEPVQQQRDERMSNVDANMEQHVFSEGDKKSQEMRMVSNMQISGSSAVFAPQQNSVVYQQLDSNGSEYTKQFVVAVIPQTKSSKNLDYVHGGAMTKNGRTLYCKADVMIPFTFTFPKKCNPGSHVRVRAEYAEGRYLARSVERCPNHLVKDASDVKMHFVRCDHAETEYFGSNENYSLCIPMCETTSFMFTCFSSCSGGINRRPIQLTFILEGRDERQVETFRIPLKVCANPLRDASKENERSLEALPNTQTVWNSQGIQRKRPQVRGNYTSKRTHCHEHAADSNHVIEIHFADPRKASKVLWLLQNEDKLDQLLCMDVDENPFREIYVPTAATSIKAWLNRPNIGLASFADKFERHAVFTLGDLARIYHHEIFACLGFEPCHCTILNKAFCDWYLSKRAHVTGSIEVNSGHGHHPQIL